MNHTAQELLAQLEIHKKNMATVVENSGNTPYATPLILREHAFISIIVSELAEIETKRIVSLTRKLVFLTWGLVAVSVALLAFALMQTEIMVKQNPNANPQQIQAGQHLESATPKQ